MAYEIKDCCAALRISYAPSVTFPFCFITLGGPPEGEIGKDGEAKATLRDRLQCKARDADQRQTQRAQISTGSTP